MRNSCPLRIRTRYLRAPLTRSDSYLRALHVQFCTCGPFLEDVSSESPFWATSSSQIWAQSSSFGPSLKGHEFRTRAYTKTAVGGGHWASAIRLSPKVGSLKPAFRRHATYRVSCRQTRLVVFTTIGIIPDLTPHHRLLKLVVFTTIGIIGSSRINKIALKMPKMSKLRGLPICQKHAIPLWHELFAQLLLHRIGALTALHIFCTYSRLFGRTAFLLFFAVSGLCPGAPVPVA